MAAPASLVNDETQSVDTLYGEDGTGRLKLAVGSTTGTSLDPEIAWEGVATHVDGDTFDSGDGVAVIAVLDGATVRPAIGDSDGRALVRVVPSSDDLTDSSTTVAAGTTSQIGLAANPDRIFLLIHNLSATEDLWINFTDDAAIDTVGSIRIVAKGEFRMDGTYVSPEVVNVTATTTGHKFTAKEA